MNKLKTVVILLAILIAAACCSFYLEADYRRWVRYLYEFTSAGKISFILPKKYLHFISASFVLSFLLFTTGMFLFLTKESARKILIQLVLAVLLFLFSTIIYIWLDGLLKLTECSACNDGTMRLSYYEVEYDMIFISSLCVAFVPGLLTEIKLLIKVKTGSFRLHIARKNLQLYVVSKPHKCRFYTHNHLSIYLIFAVLNIV